MKTSPVCQLRRVVSTVCVLLVTLVGPVVAPAAAADKKGWYTKAQAKRGQQLFNNNCAECHRPDLTGAMGPALIGNKFLKKWETKPIDDLFNFAHTEMPAVNPGSLPADETWAILAYILQKNGFPTGPTPLNEKTEGKRILTGK